MTYGAKMERTEIEAEAIEIAYKHWGDMGRPAEDYEPLEWAATQGARWALGRVSEFIRECEFHTPTAVVEFCKVEELTFVGWEKRERKN